jgi:predicted dehydrogenase
MVTIALIGAGARGKDAYGAWIARNRGRARIVAVAEPVPARRTELADAHGIPASMRFEGWEELLAGKRLAEACIIATQDRDHTEPALAALALGYDVLLEKPMAPTEAECRALVRRSEESGSELRICHVLRYTAFFTAIKGAIDAGAIGEIATMAHSENVAYWHFAHSYVRGDWRRSADAGSLILAKSCHDLDILAWLAGGSARRIQSFGSLEFYRSEKAPAGAPARCLEGCPAASTCPWFAPRLYLHGTPILGTFRFSPSRLVRGLARAGTDPRVAKLVDWRAWPASVICDDPSRAARMRALENGPYGRCVFRCDNDVVDRQTVNMEFDNGVAAVFGLHGHSYQEGRSIRIDGSRGTIEGSFGLAGQVLKLRDHYRGKSRILLRSASIFSGHGGGDAGLMESFVAALQDKKDGKAVKEPLSSAGASLHGHLMCFAAEKSRLEAGIVSIE